MAIATSVFNRPVIPPAPTPGDYYYSVERWREIGGGGWVAPNSYKLDFTALPADLSTTQNFPTGEQIIITRGSIVNRGVGSFEDPAEVTIRPSQDLLLTLTLPVPRYVYVDFEYQGTVYFGGGQVSFGVSKGAELKILEQPGDSPLTPNRLNSDFDYFQPRSDQFGRYVVESTEVVSAFRFSWVQLYGLKVNEIRLAPDASVSQGRTYLLFRDSSDDGILKIINENSPFDTKANTDGLERILDAGGGITTEVDPQALKLAYVISAANPNLENVTWINSAAPAFPTDAPLSALLRNDSGTDLVLDGISVKAGEIRRPVVVNATPAQWEIWRPFNHYQELRSHIADDVRHNPLIVHERWAVPNSDPRTIYKAWRNARDNTLIPPLINEEDASDRRQDTTGLEPYAAENQWKINRNIVVQGGGSFANPVDANNFIKYLLQDKIAFIVGEIDWVGTTGGDDGISQYSIDLTQLGITPDFEGLRADANSIDATPLGNVLVYSQGSSNITGSVAVAAAKNSITFVFGIALNNQSDWGNNWWGVSARPRLSFSAIIPVKDTGPVSGAGTNLTIVNQLSNGSNLDALIAAAVQAHVNAQHGEAVVVSVRGARSGFGFTNYRSWQTLTGWNANSNIQGTALDVATGVLTAPVSGTYQMAFSFDFRAYYQVQTGGEQVSARLIDADGAVLKNQHKYPTVTGGQTITTLIEVTLTTWLEVDDTVTPQIYIDGAIFSQIASEVQDPFLQFNLLSVVQVG